MDNNELRHHGIKGQKWGVRRFQNEDGSLTEEGREHYNKQYDNANKAFKVSGIALAGSIGGRLIGLGAAVAGSVLGGPVGTTLVLGGASGYTISKFTGLASIGSMATSKALAAISDKKLIDDDIRRELSHGDEWDVHKYIDKVKTKTGNIRYIYGNVKKAAKSELSKYADKVTAYSAVVSDSTKVVKESFNQLKEYFSGTKPKKLSDLKKQSSTLTPEQDMEAVNPNYGSDHAGSDFAYTNNCAFCSAAYDMRRRGYDVEADEMVSYNANITDDILSWYNGAKEYDKNNVCSSLTPEDHEYVNDNFIGPYGYPESYFNAVLRSYALSRHILKNQDITGSKNSRGIVTLNWAGGGGHAIAYEVNNDGVVCFYDAQLNQEIDIVNYIAYADNFSYIRTDNCKPNENIVEALKNRK